MNIDGARFFHALVSTGAGTVYMPWKAGVDALSFEATKNGVLAAEATVLFDPALVDEMRLRRKHRGAVVEDAAAVGPVRRLSGR